MQVYFIYVHIYMCKYTYMHTSIHAHIYVHGCVSLSKPKLRMRRDLSEQQEYPHKVPLMLIPFICLFTIQTAQMVGGECHSRRSLWRSARPRPKASWAADFEA